MKPSGEIDMMGGEDKVVEADETYIGNKGKHEKGARGWSHKEKVFSLYQFPSLNDECKFFRSKLCERIFNTLT